MRQRSLTYFVHELGISISFRILSEQPTFSCSRVTPKYIMLHVPEQEKSHGRITGADRPRRGVSIGKKSSHLASSRVSPHLSWPQ